MNSKLLISALAVIFLTKVAVLPVAVMAQDSESDDAAATTVVPPQQPSSSTQEVESPSSDDSTDYSDYGSEDDSDF